MRSKVRGVSLFACGAVFCLAVLGIGIAEGLSGQTVEYNANDGKEFFLEMTVGETYDLKELFEGKFPCTDVYTNGGVFGGEEGLELDGNGLLHAVSGGVYEDVKIFAQHYSDPAHPAEEALARLDVIVYDYEFDDYIPVRGYDDLSDTEGDGKYILTKDFTVRRQRAAEIADFSGMLVNPYGYTITVADNFPLFELVRGAVRGLKVRTDENGITFSYNDSQGDVVSAACGLIAADTQGYLVECAAEGDIYIKDDAVAWAAGVSGVCTNGGAVLRSSFRGNLFECRTEGTSYECRVFGISASGLPSDPADLAAVRDCTVYADAYYGSEKDPAEAFTALHADADPSAYSSRLGDDGTIKPGVQFFPKNGNRVFDLSGEHEVNFDAVVEYSTQTENCYNEMTYDVLFAGSVAVLPQENMRLIRSSGAKVAARTLNGAEVPTDEIAYLPSDSVQPAHLWQRALYEETSVYDDDGTLYIHAAEERVTLPDGVFSGYSVGPFCPEEMVLAFSAQTSFSRDNLPFSSSAKITMDVSASEIYEEREDGIYRSGAGILCLYTGETPDGVLTIPDGVTQMSSSALRGCVFNTLYTNGLQSTGSFFGEEQVKVLRIGTAFDPLYLSVCNFTALGRIEADERTDGYAVREGMLTYNGDFCYIPQALCEGGTLTLDGGSVLEGAGEGIRAADVVFGDVPRIEDGAFSQAEISGVYFTGRTTAESGAFGYCSDLTAVAAREGASVTLLSGAFTSCGALEHIELNGGFASVAYDAVRFADSFRGYVQEEGGAFAVVNELLFEEGNARVPARWRWGEEQKDIIVPEGFAEIGLENDGTATSVGTVYLGKDVRSIRVTGLSVSAFSADAENEALRAEDGIVFTKDRTELVIYPSARRKTEYVLPDTVKRIAAYAFYGAEYISYVECSQAEEIGEGAFAHSSLYRIGFGAGLRIVEDGAFQQTRLLNSVDFSAVESIERFGDYVFSGSGLRSAVLPEGLTALGEQVFMDAYKLTSVTLPSTLRTIGSGAFSNTGLEEISLPEGLTAIGGNAFRNAPLKEIVLPESLEEIGSYAFRQCPLESVALGKNLLTVGEYAFASCSSLAEVTAENPDTLYGSGCFSNTPFASDEAKAEGGAIYLGNTLVAFAGEGERVQVKYGTTRLLSAQSEKVRYLELPATVRAEDAVSVRYGLPALEQLWLGMVPAGMEASCDLGSRNIAPQKALYIYVPRNFTYRGYINSNVYLCYGGTQEEFEAYAQVNYGFGLDRVFYFDEAGTQPGTWHYGDGGLMEVVEREG